MRGQQVGRIMSVDPDLLLINKNTDRITYINIIGNNPNFDLPVGTAVRYRKFKRELQEPDPHLILVTGSTVPDYLEEELSVDGVDIVEIDDENDAVKDIVETIQEVNK